MSHPFIARARRDYASHVAAAVTPAMTKQIRSDLRGVETDPLVDAQIRKIASGHSFEGSEALNTCSTSQELAMADGTTTTNDLCPSHGLPMIRRFSWETLSHCIDCLREADDEERTARMQLTITDDVGIDAWREYTAANFDPARLDERDDADEDYSDEGYARANRRGGR